MTWHHRYEGAAVPAPGEEAPLIPAATVVVLRDHDASGGRGGRGGVEVLMVRRNSKLEFAGGMWVFPGGRVDPADRAPGDDGDEPAARRAAVREAAEEAGIELDPGGLVWFSHWTPPPISPKRFGTSFFATAAPRSDLQITVDGGEIHEHGWMRPTDAMARRNAHEIELAPPTWITLEELARHGSVDAALDAFRSRPPERFATQIVLEDGSAIALYAGDAGYDGGDHRGEGGRHRLWMTDGDWWYERDSWRPGEG